MRREEIEELIRLVEDSQINELEISEGRKKIRISKGPMVQSVPVPAPAHTLSDNPTTQPIENKQEDPSASTIHTVCPTATVSPSDTNGSASGLGAA
jgi:biotin carboxyl carrier protein